MKNYFEKYEDRKPPQPISYSIWRELLWQFLATVALFFGARYILWRWSCSLNYDALWFSVPLALAETLAYFGSIIFTINLWKTEDVPQKEPSQYIGDCTSDNNYSTKRPLAVDIFFTTYDEDPELVRLSVKDAKKITYPYPIDIKIHVLDDGGRSEMKNIADEEKVNYITRINNIGFKAGNLRNAMELTSGDFIVICDADTRPLSTILERTLGYFRDPKVAWVQTPQWFFDISEGRSLANILKKYLGVLGYYTGLSIEKVIGPFKIGNDPFSNDPQMFYDVIQRRRNWANASFCCGAGSVHRREAVMEAALKSFSSVVESETKKATKDITDLQLKKDLADAMWRELVFETEITPYKFHVSEDLYTSIVLHSDRDKKWKSVYHPLTETKMLSPQDLLTWTTQRFKYAGGTIDIAINDNPVFKNGLSLPQKIMYGATFYSYFAVLWNIVFLTAPIVYLFTGVAPIASYSLEFFKHVIPFLLCNSIAIMVGTWGISGFRGASTNLSFFPINLRALWTVKKGEKIKFPTTPKDRQEGNFIHLIIPQLIVVILTSLGLVYAGLRLVLVGDTHIAGYITNLFWSLNNIIALSGIIMAAFWKPEETRARKTPVKSKEKLQEAT
jgi:cellulose synthase (UDP-forming)